MDWANENKIQITGGLELDASTFGGLGWRANRQVPSGSILLSVPSDIALTVEAPGEGPDDRGVLADLFREDREGRKILLDLPWYVQMAVYLHKLDKVNPVKGNKDAGTPMRPWLDSLPRQFDTPIHWSENILANDLQYDYMARSVKRQRARWEADYKTVSSLVKVPMTWDEFLWGCECARSRAFSGAYTGSAFNPFIYAFTLLLVTAYVGLGLGSLEQAANGAGVVISVSILKDFVIPKLFKKKRYVICPMIDMANHRSYGNQGDVSYEFFGNSYTLAVANDETVSADDELFISYGSRSNDQLLQYYGFVEPNNPNDVYIMPPLREWDIDALEKACGRTFAPGRLQKLDRAGLLGSSETFPDVSSGKGRSEGDEAANEAGGVVLTRVGGVDPAVLQALRALVSSDKEWIDAGKAIGNFAEEGSGGVENEKCARLAARKAIELELASKPTTLKEDEDLLRRMDTVRSLDVSQEEKIAVAFRAEKKKLLMEVIETLV